MKYTGFLFLFLITLSLEAQTVEKEIIKLGSGTPANPGDKIKINYELWTVKSLQEKMNLKFVEKQKNILLEMDQKKILSGLYNGLLGASPGTTFTLLLPPELAYGKRTEGSIPAGSILKYEIEVLEVTPR